MADVLIVDDEEQICRYLCGTLEAFGISAAFRLTGEEAIQLLEQESFKIFVVDMKLSTSISGLDVIKTIRQKFSQAIIFGMSGYIDKNLMETALQNGAQEFLAKPSDIKMEPFMKKINEYLPKSK